MDTIRHTIVDTNKFQQAIMGFETGRVYSGIRGTSPVSITNTDGITEHIGAVEAGVSFGLVLQNLTAKSNVNAAVLLYQDHLAENVWPDYLDQRLKATPAINNLVLEQTTSDQITALLKQASNTSAPNSHLHIGNPEVTTQVIELNGQPYLYATKPLRDYLGTTDKTIADAGQIVIWEELSEPYALFNKHLKINIFYAVIAFFIIELFVFIAIRLVSRRLNHTIHIQTLELNSRNHVLEQLAREESTHTILESLAHIIETEIPDALCSILLLDNEGKHLTIGAAPSLPDFYNEAINGLKIGEGVGSCGTAATLKKRVVVKDIQSHPYWTPFKALAAKANLAACWSQPILDHNNKVLGTFAIYHHTPTTPALTDLALIESIISLATLVLERKQADEKLHLFSRIFEQTHEGITITNTDGIITNVNSVFCDITGYTRDEVIGHNSNILSSGRQSPEFYADMWSNLIQQGYWQGEVWNRKKSGEIYAELLTVSSIQDEENITRHYVGSFSDITLNKEQQKALEFMAHYDVLTQLPNRSLFVDRFNQAIAHSKRSGTLLALCFLDLDEFKPVNDTYGHDIGDELLIQVSQRIKDNIREEDTVSRQGGDEFAILLGDIDSSSQCKQLLTRLNKALAKAYLINEYSIKVSASIGVTIYPHDDADLDTLLRHADQAMYQAKLAGRNRFSLFNPEQDKQSLQKQSQLVEIEHALESNQFSLYYQAKVNMKTGKVFGAEALIRWIHPDKGIIPPLDFLPIVENTDLEIQLGNWVIKQALQQLESWRQKEINMQVSVNISSHHLQSPTFFTDLEQALYKYPQLNSNYLQLEILESSALGDLAAVSNIIKTCQQGLGVNVALDDFGTGYSSLTHLRNLPANTIKIDQSFVRDMLDDPNDYSIIDGVIGLAESFNREIIAEGVETTEHGLMLLLMGCDEAQGYGIARPLPADQFEHWLNHYIPNKEWLNCGSKYHSVKETKIKLLRLTTQHWFDEFKHKQQSLQSTDEFWPFMSHKKCHHGAWIERAKKEQTFEQDWLNQLEQAHETMHQVANNLVKNRIDSHQSISDADTAELEVAFNSLKLILGQYE